jgi:CHAT domain-containing protein
MLTIGVKQAPGLDPLPHAEDEARQVGAYFAEPVVLVGAEATRQRVLGALPQATWLHVACHARQPMEAPLDSGIALADQRLPVVDLLRLRVPNGEFAFLSACETGQIKPGMTDEVVTVAMALHRAGYPSVVATARSINDALARKVARWIYQDLTAPGRPDGDRAARAVHRATRELRDRYPDRPSVWAAYLHVGR